MGYGRTEPEKKGFSKKQKLIATMSGAALAIGLGVVGFKSMNGSDKRVAPAGPVATATANPGEQPSAAETTSPVTAETTPVSQAEVAPTVKNQEMDGALFTNPELLANTYFTERLTAWENAGATPENAQAAMASPDIAAYAVKIGAEYDKIFTEALLVDDWQSNPGLAEWVNNEIEIHRGTLYGYFLTSFPEINHLDKEPYVRSTQFDKLNETYTNKDGVLRITATFHEYDNADLNRVGEKLGNGKVVDTSEKTTTVTFVKIDGKTKLSLETLALR